MTRDEWEALGNDPRNIPPLDAEAKAEARQDFLTERAAILEYDAGMDRASADFLARRLAWQELPRG